MTSRGREIRESVATASVALAARDFLRERDARRCRIKENIDESETLNVNPTMERR
jgi:hypothetical protein